MSMYYVGPVMGMAAGRESPVFGTSSLIRPASYSVQLDVSLVHNSAKVHELEVPITVTMPIPSGLQASRLVVLHYRTDGTVETVSLKMNGDGTVTFTVDGFSTFECGALTVGFQL